MKGLPPFIASRFAYRGFFDSPGAAVRCMAALFVAAIIAVSFPRIRDAAASTVQ